MRMQIYNVLVNRKPGIRERYHLFHDNATGIRKHVSYLYLLWLNFAVYVLRIRSLGQKRELQIYEKKKLPTDISESQQACNETKSVKSYIEKLMGYDVISFDMFDTLVFRPFSEPTDIFYEIGRRFEYPDFHNIRINAEAKARTSAPGGEVNLSEIYDVISEETGLDTSAIMSYECALELKYCYANPFMLDVWSQLITAGKRMIITTDMYLPLDMIKQLLLNCGYSGYTDIYLSNEYRKSKTSGDLYDVVKEKEPGRIIHVGDNPTSDDVNATRHNIDTLPYPSPMRNNKAYRPYDMSPIIGGAYRGVITGRLYSGISAYSMDYEYGYIYGGLFVLGYCDFIHRYSTSHSIDHILFLSRDGDTLRKVYDDLYPGERTTYALWSRRAATICAASIDRYDFLRRFVYHKVDGKTTIGDALRSMGLEQTLGGDNKISDLSLSSQNLSTENAKSLASYLLSNWDQVISVTETMSKAAEKYYKSMIDPVSDRKVLVVDIGWAGSGAMTLRRLFREKWDIHSEIIGMIAGSNTPHNPDAYSAEPFLRDGVLVSYMYDNEHNRDLLKRHDPTLDYNLYWELLLSSTTPQLKGFKTMSDGSVTAIYGECDPNPDGIKDIQSGIRDFVADYIRFFGDNSFYRNISGRDAYAPMLLASSHNKAYLKKTLARYHIEPGVV